MPKYLVYGNIRLEVKAKNEAEAIAVAVTDELGDFFRRNDWPDLLKAKLINRPTRKTGEFGYADAEHILSDWDYRSLPDGEEVINAINKGLQALRDCQEMGLTGEGE